MDPAKTFVEPRLATQNAIISDVVAWWLTGVAGAFEEYTSCVNVHKNLTIYGGANPDIAGIGVRFSSVTFQLLWLLNFILGPHIINDSIHRLYHW